MTGNIMDDRARTPPTSPSLDSSSTVVARNPGSLTTNSSEGPKTTLLVFRLSEHLLKLEENRTEKMTSRKLMEISEKLGIPVGYSTGWGIELVTENESQLDINAALEMLEC